jgi:hypothetical protein
MYVNIGGFIYLSLESYSAESKVRHTPRTTGVTTTTTEDGTKEHSKP